MEWQAQAGLFALITEVSDMSAINLDGLSTFEALVAIFKSPEWKAQFPLTAAQYWGPSGLAGATSLGDDWYESDWFGHFAHPLGANQLGLQLEPRLDLREPEWDSLWHLVLV